MVGDLPQIKQLQLSGNADRITSATTVLQLKKQIAYRERILYNQWDYLYIGKILSPDDDNKTLQQVGI